MKLKILQILLFGVYGLSASSQSGPDYTYKEGDPFGTGKWYMGREIAHVMGYHGIEWLERPEREEEEKTAKLIRNLNIDPRDTIADIGAGSGFHSFKMAREASEGIIYAIDIQEEMLLEIQEKIKSNGLRNVIPLQGSEKSIPLPPSSVDKVLLVDVYHEFTFPSEMLEAIYEILKPGGQVYLVEFRLEDDWVPIKEVHKMSASQAKKEWLAAGFEFVRNIGNLPWQHCLIFKKRLN